MKNITTFDLTLLEPFDKIWCLVSGGIDSTYLAELISERFPKKTYFVNCWNPYEQSKTLKYLKQSSMFIEVRPQTQLDYKTILDESFQQIPKAIDARKHGKYTKKIFPCCRFIKHDAFKKDPVFQEENTVVISGIKHGDGTQRRIWLTQLRYGKEPQNQSKGTPTFFHHHQEGQLYCYPFRDYKERELPPRIITQLRKKYPQLTHSGCSICPVLVVFQDKFTEPKRTVTSMKYYHKIIGQTMLFPKEGDTQ